MNGIIIVNAYAKSKTELNQALRLKEELEILGVIIQIIPTDELSVIIYNGTIVNDLVNIDFCIYLDKDKHLLEKLEKLNIKLFNKASAIEICDDKLLTHIMLSNNNIPMPKTIGGVLCYYPDAKVKKSILDKVEKELSYPVIIKESYGSCGKSVYLAKNRLELEQIADNVKLKPHIFQEFIKESSGTDTRVIVIGGKFIGAMCRQNTNDFRSNIELGGNGYKAQLTAAQIALCQNVAKTLNLDYCGIDLLTNKNNQPLVCEVNSNAFFGMFESITKINVAKLYSKYIIEKVNNQ